MKKKFFANLVFIFNLLLFNIFLISSSVINVCELCNFTKIQDAINSAGPSDIINLSKGVYNEKILVNKTLIIKSEFENNLVKIKCYNENFCLNIKSDNVVIDSVTIESNKSSGVYIEGNNNIIRNTIITSLNEELDEFGIYMNNSFNNVLSGNEIFNWNYGIYNNLGKNDKISDNYFYKNSHAIFNYRNENTKILNNTVKNNSYGVSFLDFINPKTKSSDVYKNIIEKNYNGVLINGTSFINISSNKIYNNNYGIKIEKNFYFLNANDSLIFYNDISNNQIGIISNGSYGVINFNNITNYYNLINQNSLYIDAKYNWWGNCNPEQKITGNVLFDPILGACVMDTNANKNCIFPHDTIDLYANVISQVCIEKVLFEVKIDNNLTNYTAVPLNSEFGNYKITLNSDDLIPGKNHFWSVFAYDCYGNLNKSNLKSFYVNRETVLSVDKQDPDGLNGWYITEPLFRLQNSDAKIIFYKWDNSKELIYTNPFNLTDIPNKPSKSAGILKLKFWSSNECGNESEKTKTFKIDLSDPVIKDVEPENGTTLNKKRPLIYAYIDDVYAENSGIDESSIVLKINGDEVNKKIYEIVKSDLIVRYYPEEDLREGLNNVTIFAKDKAGRSSELTWYFYINSSNIINLNVYSPENKTYDTRIIKINLTSDEKVSRIEILNEGKPNSKWRLLCSNCDEFGNSKKKNILLNEGKNKLIIKATDFYGNEKSVELEFFIDSVKPIIHSTKPFKNSFFNGSDFYIKYTEDNLRKITLFFGNENLTKNITNENCSSGKKQECSFELETEELKDFDGKKIYYWFRLEDPVREIDSKKSEVIIDLKKPQIEVTNPLNDSIYSKNEKIQLTINVTEKSNLEFLDSLISEKWKLLCANCDHYNKAIKFSRGDHHLLIKATDKAGNYDTEEISFKII